MSNRLNSEEDDALNRGYFGIHGDNELWEMSNVQLYVELAKCKHESPKFLALERELKKRHAKDQADISQRNIFVTTILGTCAGAGALEILKLVVTYFS